MKLEQVEIKEPLDTSHTITEKLFKGHEYPWEVLDDINGFIENLGASLPENEYKKIGRNAWIHKTAQVAPATTMGEPMIIGSKVQIRNGASLEGSAILGQHVVIGSSYGIKNSIIFNETQVSHFDYISDSILSYKAHMGAGAVTSNAEADKGLIEVHTKDGDVETGRKKFGVILGDHTEISCSSILNPGTVIGRNSNVYPLSSVHERVPSDFTYKGQNNIVVKEAREVEAEQEVPEAPEKGRGGLKAVK